MGIAAGLLGSVERRLVESGADDDLLADLRRAQRLTEGLDPYVARCTTPASPALAELERRTASADWRERTAASGTHLEQEMLSGHVEGQLLRMLVLLSGAQRVLDVGMFTGYSALAMAEALPPTGRVVACEIDPATAALARDCFDGSPAGDRIEVALGRAADTLDRLRSAGEKFDLVFLDADKAGYLNYLRVVLGDDGSEGDPGLLAPGGLVCADNTLLQGEPWAGGPVPGPISEAGLAIATFNETVAVDPRTEQVLLPVRDGLTLLRRV